jgi:hypothetical protein
MNVNKSAMHGWVKLFKNEHDGIMPKATPVTEDKLKIHKLERRIKRIRYFKKGYSYLDVGLIKHCTLNIELKGGYPISVIQNNYLQMNTRRWPILLDRYTSIYNYIQQGNV